MPGASRLTGIRGRSGWPAAVRTSRTRSIASPSLQWPASWCILRRAASERLPEAAEKVDGAQDLGRRPFTRSEAFRRRLFGAWFLLESVEHHSDWRFREQEQHPLVDLRAPDRCLGTLVYVLLRAAGRQVPRRRHWQL